MSTFMYNAAKLRILQGAVDLGSDEIKVALITAAYVADADGDEYVSDLSGEVTGTGYTAGGKVLQNKALTRDNANDLVIFDADAISWTVAGFTARAAVLYKDTGVPATSPLLACIDFEEDLEASGEDFILEWHEDGILTLGD